MKKLKILLSEPVHAVFDPKKQQSVTAYASTYGLRLTLYQKQKDSLMKIIICAFRTLTEMGKHYTQIEKETLAHTWECEKFSN